MEYFDIIEIARRAKPLDRVKIQGGQTNGFIKQKTEPKPVPKDTEYLKGKDYALKYQQEDELEEIEEPESSSGKGGMSAVDELTSVGTLPNIDLVDDHLLQVYDNYPFNIKTDNKLLIHEYKDEILEQIDVSPVVIVKGGTGCGKTTQVPQFILDSCRENNIYCNIVVTQPRRIAAISVAKRVCQERGWNVGSLVGYQIALEKTVSKDTRLLYCTTGVLLHQLVAKQDLSNYTHIIIDEVHERDQETDFLLILVKRFLRTIGSRTKIILMSATINIEKFVNYFSRRINNVQMDPPVIELQQIQRHPVHYYYLDDLMNKIPLSVPLIEIDRPGIDSAGYDLAVTLLEAFAAIDKSEHKNSDFIRSVLIFLPGLHEIETLYERLTKRLLDTKHKVEEKWWLCPLHSSVTFEEQLKVFKAAPAGFRKIILTTNIAESSITVPDVKYVIDFCLMKEQVLEAETSYTCLQPAWISKSQGEQRAGRVGRVMSGRVYRLVPKEMYENFNEDCSPEMLRSPLDQLVLKAKRLSSGSPASILGRALDPPDLSNIHRTILNLKEVGALLMTCNGRYVEDDGDLTFIGHVMATLPLDIHLSKLIILGHMFGLLKECVVMACAMSLKSIFSTPFKQQLEAYNLKLSWADSSCSDPIAFFNAYKTWRYNTTIGKFKRPAGLSEGEWARRYFIQLQVIKEVARLENEVFMRLKYIGITERTNDAAPWDENVQKPLMLKIVIAGAFYPNFFLRRQVDEKEAVKMLGGRDPFSTVYLTNMPLNQPGKLYAKSIKKHFSHCGSQISTFFDGSSKVYLQFGSNSVEAESNNGNQAMMPGKIMMAVYRAIKLRHLQTDIRIPILPVKEAERRATELFGQSRLSTYCFTKRKEPAPSKTPSILPSVRTNFLEVIIPYIEDPSKFWVQINSIGLQEKLFWMHNEINSEVAAKKTPVLSTVKIGESVIAPFRESGDNFYYRAVVTALLPKKDSLQVQVLYVDYGNSLWMKLNDLFGWNEKLKQVKDEPHMAVPAMLSEIQPSTLKNPKGLWSRSVVERFKSQFENKKGFAKVYSVVEGMMSLILFNQLELTGTPNLEDFPFEKSFNNLLIETGFAERAEEPYLSKENHLAREKASTFSDMSQGLGGVPTLSSDLSEGLVDVDSPTEEECRYKTVLLKGPRSPLEMNLYSLTKKSQGFEVKIEWSSVNSVLLDTYPMDPHDRLLVAAVVSQSPSGDKITLRNTTMMPNMHGLCALLAMIFAPYSELRSDPEHTQLTGVLCGLGFDKETGVPYNAENDIELTFDTKIDLSDLENINRVRFWMNHIVSGGSDWETEVTAPKVAFGQQKLKEFILELLLRPRPSCKVVNYESNFTWDQVEEERRLHPRDGGEETPTIFPLIWGIDLDEPEPGDPTIERNLELLKQYASEKVAMKNGVLCKLCVIFMDNALQVRLHLKSQSHQDALSQYHTSLKVGDRF